MKEYDLIVLGGGTAGMGVARSAAADGWKTAVVEVSRLGGTCVNVGCIPSKTLISSASTMQTVRNAHHYGVIAESPRADWPAMLDRKEKLITEIRKSGYKSVEKNNNITLYEGEAAFTDSHVVEVNGESLAGERIVIATGARPAVPPVPGLSDIDYLTSTSAMEKEEEMEKLPRSLLVLGAGTIALEFSQLFVRLGVDVTILQRGDRLASNLEPEISDEIRKVFESEGINIKSNVNISSIGSENGSIFVVDETDNGPLRYTADQILVATGRTPNTDMLNLENAGVETDKKGHISVNDNFETSTSGIWAIGDVIGGMMFTHKAWHDGLLLSRNILKGSEIISRGRLIPFTIFTDPEIAGVGMGEEAAVEAGYKKAVKRFPFSNSARALAMEKRDGFIKLIIDSNKGKILGAHIIGPEAGELIHELLAAMRFGATVYDLQDMIHVHPTLSEAINNTAWLK